MALTVHDFGEGELLRDVLDIDKNSASDLDEYLAFKKRTEQFPFFVAARLEKAYLLQYAKQNPENFPPEARRIMRDLVRDHPMEIRAFEAIERWDYLLFALEQYQERGNRRILTQVLRRQAHHLRRLADELTGFNRIWTLQVDEQFQAFLRQHQGQWIEENGD